jgi:hypothetical protein
LRVSSHGTSLQNCALAQCGHHFHTKDIIMLYQILIHTPRWVWLLLLALLALGLSQAVTRSASLKRITVVPLAMTGLSLYGTVAAFGGDSQILLIWLGAVALMANAVMRLPLPDACRYDPATRRFTLPGSWVPMLLILGLFCTKYVVGVAIAMHPALALDAGFRLGFSTLYGAFSGVFLARAGRLWRQALQIDRRPGTIVAA